MKSTILSLLIIALTAAVSASANVLELNSETFKNHIAEHDLTLVKFFAPWCGHCKSLAPEYETAAAQLEGKHIITEVDCTKDRELCTEHGVRGFPTIKLFHKSGSVVDYEDARKADNIVRFVLKQGQPAYTVFASAAEAEEFKKVDGNGVKVILTTTSADSAEAEAFKKVAAALRNDVDFAIIVDQYAYEASAKLYRAFDEPEVATSSVTEESLTKFIKSESLPLFGEIGPENYQRYVERSLPLVWAFVDYTDEKQVATVADAVLPVAKAHRSDVLFVKLDGRRWGEHAKTFGLPGTTPGLALEDRGHRKNYIFPADKEVTAANVEEHVKSFLSGSLEATVRSQAIPEKNDEPVTVVVGKSWESIVLDNTKDVLIEFYAPWCGHCKSLAPKYELLGQEFEKNSNIVIAKIDGSENDTPVEIQGFPTIFFYPANDKTNPIQYSGDRSLESLVKFIRTHQTVEDVAAAEEKSEL